MPMKNFQYLCRVAEGILCLLLFFSCSVEEQESSAGSRDSESRAIIENARTFFETSIIKTRSESAPLFDLGNIVPDWDNAVISDRDSLQAVDVAFRSEYCLKVTRPKVLGDTTKLYNVSAWQKLVMLENKETGNRTYAYVTLVPSHGYYRQHKHMDVNTFVQYGDKGDFTGHAIYTDVTNNVIFRVNFYIAGVKRCGATILGNKEHQAANIAKMRRMLAGMYFKKKTNILTRSGDEWDIDGSWLDDVPIVGHDPWFDNDDDWANDDDDNDDDWTEEDDWDDSWYYRGDDNGSIVDNTLSEPEKELPNSSEIVTQILNSLAQSKVAAKLLAVVPLDKIHVMDSSKKGYYGVTKNATGEIFIYEQRPHILLEELMHRYQNSNFNIHGGYKGNAEIEAKLLVYDYFVEQYKTESGIAANMGSLWVEFGKFAENPCQETWVQATSLLYNRMGYNPSDFKTSDYSEFRTDNYDRIK